MFFRSVSGAFGDGAPRGLLGQETPPSAPNTPSHSSDAHQLGEPPIFGLFKAIGGALRFPGTSGKYGEDVLSEHDPYGFRRNPRHARWEVAWEAHNAKHEARQELLWVEYEGDRSDMEPSSGAAQSLSQLVRGGIPAWRRKRMWPRLVQADAIRRASPELHFQQLLEQAEREPIRKIDEQIELDLPRTFPGHVLLSTEDGIQALRQVLVAYSRRQPNVGYVQGMGFIAALLLVVLRDAEDAFWCLAAVLEYRLPKNFLEGSLQGMLLEQAVFQELVNEREELANVLAGVPTELYTTPWFVACFANTFPIETRLRTWDIFLLEGISVIHQVGMAVLQSAAPKLQQCADTHGQLCCLQEEEALFFDANRLLELSFSQPLVSQLQLRILRSQNRHRISMCQTPVLPVVPPASSANPAVSEGVVLYDGGAVLAPRLHKPPGGGVGSIAPFAAVPLLSGAVVPRAAAPEAVEEASSGEARSSSCAVPALYEPLEGEKDKLASCGAAFRDAMGSTFLCEILSDAAGSHPSIAVVDRARALVESQATRGADASAPSPSACATEPPRVSHEAREEEGGATCELRTAASPVEAPVATPPVATLHEEERALKGEADEPTVRTQGAAVEAGGVSRQPRMSDAALPPVAPSSGGRQRWYRRLTRWRRRSSSPTRASQDRSTLPTAAIAVTPQRRAPERPSAVTVERERCSGEAPAPAPVKRQPNDALTPEQWIASQGLEKFKSVSYV